MTPFEYTNSIGEKVVARVYNIHKLEYVHNEEFGTLDPITLITGTFDRTDSTESVNDKN